MIGRIWHGWTNRQNADAYEELLKAEILPGIQRVEGYRGVYVLRREANRDVEFVTLTIFDSLDAVRRFAGEDYEVAVIPHKVRALLSRFDSRSAHYQIIAAPDTAQR